MALQPHGAMNPEFWRDEQKLNVFRTTRCQRLAVDGTCQWGSKCQFSHYLEWPRRQPKKYHYSPELCPSIMGAEQCVKGVNCPYAHSMEEVLFHPELFKTVLCAEQGRARRNKDVGKPNRCHRYYCPFAHGKKELRESSFGPEQLDQFYHALEQFPSDECCGFCAPRLSAGGAVEPVAHHLPESIPLPVQAGPLLLGGVVSPAAAFRMSRLIMPPGLIDEYGMMGTLATKGYGLSMEAKPTMKHMEPAYIRIVDGITSITSGDTDKDARIFNML